MPWPTRGAWRPPQQAPASRAHGAERGAPSPRFPSAVSPWRFWAALSSRAAIKSLSVRRSPESRMGGPSARPRSRGSPESAAQDAADEDAAYPDQDSLS